MISKLQRDLDIVHLVDAPGAAATLARWFVETWEPWYGPDGPGDAEADLVACCGRESLPFCLVARDPEGTLLGTVALRADSVGSESAPGPWLTSLLVRTAHRRRGVATALVAAMEAEAWRLGFAAIYTSTNVIERRLECRGWRACGRAESRRGPVTIYRLDRP